MISFLSDKEAYANFKQMSNFQELKSIRENINSKIIGSE